VQRFWTRCKREHLPRADSNLDLILSKDRGTGIRLTRTNIEIGKGGWRDNYGAGSFFDVRF
jgi:hypothetical protein